MAQVADMQHAGSGINNASRGVVSGSARKIEDGNRAARPKLPRVRALIADDDVGTLECYYRD